MKTPLNRPPILTRMMSFFVGTAMWSLWAWMLIPAPVSQDLRRRIIETSLWPTVHVIATLVALYVAAVSACRIRRRAVAVRGVVPRDFA